MSLETGLSSQICLPMIKSEVSHSPQNIGFEVPILVFAIRKRQTSRMGLMRESDILVLQWWPLVRPPSSLNSDYFAQQRFWLSR